WQGRVAGRAGRILDSVLVEVQLGLHAQDGLRPNFGEIIACQPLRVGGRGVGPDLVLILREVAHVAVPVCARRDFRCEHVGERLDLVDGPGDHHNVGFGQCIVDVWRRIYRLRRGTQVLREWNVEVRGETGKLGLNVWSDLVFQVHAGDPDGQQLAR